jgi:hypothetical protein
MPNNHKRNKIYRELAKSAGYRERQPLPVYQVKVVREVFPKANGKYVGFKLK